MQPSPANADSPRRIFIRLLLVVNLMGLMLVAVWFRSRSLDNIPGINGDEVWYGAQAMGLLQGDEAWYSTPTGNPPNPFFFGPVLGLHLFFGPSIAMLRWVAVLSGLAALALNWWLCRWVFDRQTAVISSVLLAVLPINIAYSRFAWDASQSLLATLPVLYLALAAAKWPGQARRLIVGAGAVLLAAVLVHPTNILSGAAIATTLAIWLRFGDVKRLVADGTISRRMIVGLVTATIVLAAVGVVWLNSASASRFTDRMAGLEEVAQPGSLARFSVLFPRSITGGTAYRYIAGSQSWAQWPCRPKVDEWGIDVVVFWAMLLVAIGMLWRSWRRDGRIEDRLLLSAWALQVTAFLVLIGPRAMTPGFERYAICLVGPTVLVLARGFVLCVAQSWRQRHIALAAGSLLAWLMLIEFQVHYFDFIQRTGGRAHDTFRTAATEPKQAAFEEILRQRQSLSDSRRPVWIVAGEYWNELPLRYLASDHPDINVVRPEQVEGSEAYREALSEGRVWFVEFSNSEELQCRREELAEYEIRSWRSVGYDGKPVLSVLHASPGPEMERTENSGVSVPVKSSESVETARRPELVGKPQP